jgi:hypothetical protein
METKELCVSYLDSLSIIRAVGSEGKEIVFPPVRAVSGVIVIACVSKINFHARKVSLVIFIEHAECDEEA